MTKHTRTNDENAPIPDSWLGGSEDPLEAQFRAERLAREAAEYARRSQAAGPRPAPPAPERSERTSEQPRPVDPPAREGAVELKGPLARIFMLAGNAIFTMVSKKTGARFTFKLSRPEPDPVKDAEHKFYHGRPRRQPIFVAVLSGPQNTDDYTYLGQLWEDGEKVTYDIGRKSRVSAAAPSQKAAVWLASALNMPEKLAQCEIYHEGRCGRCGRRLTVPSSIETGLGPECAGKMGG